MAKAKTGPENAQVSNLMQDQKTGKLVEFIGIHDKEYAMIRDGAGNVSYVTLEQLVPYSPEKGRLSKIASPIQVIEDEPFPDSIIPAEDTRLNLNTASAEQIAKRLPGVGKATAKSIVELKLSLSGERFSNLKQLENIPRVNWDQFIEEDLIFIA